MTDTSPSTPASGERADILETLRVHRYFLRQTTDDLTDEQARHRSTVSELTLGGLIKHVALTEARWVDFILEGPSAMQMPADGDFRQWENAFRLLDGETLAGWLTEYERVAARTDDLVGTVDLDAVQPLPEAPWFPKDGTQSARRTFLHIIAETAQHAGHADIIREAIDGKKSMG